MWALPISPQPMTATPTRSLAPKTDLLNSVTEARLAACRKNSRRVCHILTHPPASASSGPVPKPTRILRRRWRLPYQGGQR
ncbi:MAG: hypothetical protein PVTTEEND_001298 [Candidatus Fervidibacter sp.]